MSDPLSVTASAAGLVSLGLTVCSGLLEYYSAWKHQPSDVSAMCESLVALNKTFELLDEKIRHPLLDRKSVDRVNESIISCAAAIQGLRTKLDKIRNAKTGISARIQRAQYPFQQKTLEKLLRTISDLRGNLSLATSTLQLEVSTRSLHQLNQFDKDIKKLIVGQEEEKLRALSVEEQDVINSFSPLDFSSKHNDALSRRQEGTGQWLLKSTEFRSWLDTAGTVLWCPGMPGAGKTVLASMVIDHLEQSYRSEKIGVAYVYCVHNGTDQTASNFLGSLLQQLAIQSIAILEDVKLFHKHHIRYGTRPSFNDIAKLLRLQVEKFDEVFIVIDALDECPEFDQVRRHLIAEVRGLLPKIRLMVTSRSLLSIESMFKDDNHLEIRAQEQDVRSFIESQMDQRPELVGLLEGHDDVRSMITAMVLDRTNGMFLIAALHMDSLAKEDNIRDLKDSLKRLPEDLDKTYDDALERIRSQDSRKLARADQVLTLISCAKRPLKLEEMRQALSIRSGDTFLDPEALPKTESLISTCCGLVVVEDESQIVRLVHYTTEEYFKRQLQHYRSSEAHGYLAGILVTYLSFTTFANFSMDKKIESLSRSKYFHRDLGVGSFMEKLFKDSILVQYAAENWGNHARDAFANIGNNTNAYLPSIVSHNREANNLWNLEQLILEFLQKQHNIACANQVRHYSDKKLYWLFWMRARDRGPTNVTNLQIVASFGIQYFVQYYLNQGAEIDARDSGGMTALHKASKYGHVDTVRLLLDSGAAIVLRDREGLTALFWAVSANHVSLSRLLLQSASDPGSETNSFSTISIAAWYGYEEMLQLLAEYMTDELKRSRLLSDALHDAIAAGHEGVVRLLIRGGKNWNIPKRNLKGAISQAAGGNHVTMMEILLEAGVDLSSPSPLGGSLHGEVIGSGNFKDMPLHRAVRNGHEEAVALLLEKGVDIDALDPIGNTAMILLAKSNHLAKNTVSIAQQLLERGADIAATDSEFNQTALEWAVLGGNEKLVRLLLQYESFSATRQNLMLYLTRLYRAIKEQNNEAIDHLLREKEVQELGGVSKLLVLSIPAKRGYEDVVRTFFKLGATLKAENVLEKTALHLAAEGGHLAVVKFLLDEAADVNAKDSEGVTPLMMAAEEGRTNVIELLLNHGAKIDATSTDELSCNAVARAIRRGRIETAKVLLERGADPNSRYVLPGQRELTLLHAIAEKSYLGRSSIDMLLEKGADLEAKDSDNQTPLIVAVSKSRYAVELSIEPVQYLLERGANLEARDNNDQTALVMAVRIGNIKAVQFLLERGADPQALSPAIKIADDEVYEPDFDEAVKLVLIAQSKTKR